MFPRVPVRRAGKDGTLLPFLTANSKRWYFTMFPLSCLLRFYYVSTTFLLPFILEIHGIPLVHPGYPAGAAARIVPLPVG